MVETLVVDGYNVLSAFAASRLVDHEDVDRARYQLLNLLTSCSAYWGMRLIIVFDAMHVSGGLEREETLGPNAKVIFTAEGVSADTVIESLTWVLSQHERLIIATSDRAEQNYVFGKGALRWPARELAHRVRIAQSEMTKTQWPEREHHTLHGRLSPGVLAVLNRLRLEPMQDKKAKD